MLTTLAGLSTIVETLNGNGVSFASNIKLSDSKQNMGNTFIKASLIAQLVILAGFVSLVGYFHFKCLKKGPFPKNVKGVITTLYCSSVLIGLRAIYRTVEYYSISSLRVTLNMDTSSVSPIIRYEVFFWIFEALLMLINSFLMNFRHPLRFLPRDSRVYLTQDGSGEVVGPGYEDMRFFLVAMVDPFDLIGLIMGRHRTKNFWKTNTSPEGQSKDVNEPAGSKENDIENGMSGNAKPCEN